MIYGSFYFFSSITVNGIRLSKCRSKIHEMYLLLETNSISSCDRPLQLIENKIYSFDSEFHKNSLANFLMIIFTLSLRSSKITLCD